MSIAPAVLPAIPTLEWQDRPARVMRTDASSPQIEVKLEAHCDDGVAGFEVRMIGRTFLQAGQAVDANHRVLSMRLAKSGAGREHVRWRAISSRGMLSRALHLTLEGA
jgi:hypothetical protein